MKVHVIYIAVILGLLLLGFIGKNKYTELEKEKTRSEERIKFYEQDAKKQKAVTDSLLVNAASLNAVIEYQKKNPKIIVEKYDKIRSNLNLLNTDEQIEYLANALSKESGNR